MTITGKITNMLPLRQGMSKAGKPWRKQEYVLTTNERFPKTICFAVWNEKIESLNLLVGYEYNVDIDIESSEYQGKYIHSIIAYNASIKS